MNSKRTVKRGLARRDGTNARLKNIGRSWDRVGPACKRSTTANLPDSRPNLPSRDSERYSCEAVRIRPHCGTNGHRILLAKMAMGNMGRYSVQCARIRRGDAYRLQGRHTARSGCATTAPAIFLWRFRSRGAGRVCRCPGAEAPRFEKTGWRAESKDSADQNCLASR
jgi:hypothetical protein